MSLVLFVFLCFVCMLSKCWTVTLLYPNLSTVLSVSCVFLLNKYQQCRLCAVFTIWTKYPLLANASLLNLPHRPHRSPLIPVACRSEQRVGRLQPLQELRTYAEPAGAELRRLQSRAEPQSRALSRAVPQSRAQSRRAAEPRAELRRATCRAAQSRAQEPQSRYARAERA